MNKATIRITQGDILDLMLKKDPRSKESIATELGVHPKYLSKLIRMERLPSNMIEKTCHVLGYDTSVYSTGELLDAVLQMRADNELRDANSRVSDLRIKALEAQIEMLRAENLILKKPNSN